jgi:hypothetical protein
MRVFRQNVVTDPLPSNGYTRHSIVRFTSVTTDGIWIEHWIYWPLVYTIRNYTLQITDTHTDYCPQPITISTSRFLATDLTQEL